MNGTNIKFMTINANGVSTDRRLELPNYHAKLESSNEFIVLKCNTNSDQAKHGVAVMIDRAALAPNTELASLYFPVDDPRARMSHMRCLPWALLAGCLNAGDLNQLVDLFDVFYDDDEHPVTRVGYANQRDATLDRWFVPMTVAALAMACDVRPTTSDHHAVIVSFTSPQHSHSSRPRRVRTMPVEFLKQPPILAC